MFEPTCEFPVKTGAAFLSNNLSTFHHKAKSQTYAAYVGKEAVQLLCWNEKMEQVSCELLSQDEIWKRDVPTAVTNSMGSNNDKRQPPIALMQVQVCLPANRSSPVLVILASTFVSIVDFKTRKKLFSEQSGDIRQQPAADTTNNGKSGGLKPSAFTRGITCVENLILAGCNSGDIVQIACTGDNSFQSKKHLKEHTVPVTDIASCIFDLITVSGDVSGNVLVWSKHMKSVSKRISTNQPLSVLNILRKQVFCANLLGQITVYSALSGSMLAEINAHSRQITALTVATESAYIMSASEDTYVRCWKLHSRNPEAYKIEFRYAQRFENLPIMGAAFANTRGSAYLVSFYENFKLLHFKIARRPNSTNPTDAALTPSMDPSPNGGDGGGG